MMRKTLTYLKEHKNKFTAKEFKITNTISSILRQNRLNNKIKGYLIKMVLTDLHFITKTLGRNSNQDGNQFIITRKRKRNLNKKIRHLKKKCIILTHLMGHISNIENYLKGFLILPVLQRETLQLNKNTRKKETKIWGYHWRKKHKKLWILRLVKFKKAKLRKRRTKAS